MDPNVKVLLTELGDNLAAIHTPDPAEAAARKQAQAELESRDRLTPLETRLARLLDSIPRAVQEEGISLPVIQKMLRGRWRGNPPAGHVGQALRALGWRRERRWRGDAEGFRALWLAPTRND